MQRRLSGLVSSVPRDVALSPTGPWGAALPGAVWPRVALPSAGVQKGLKGRRWATLPSAGLQRVLGGGAAQRCLALLPAGLRSGFEERRWAVLSSASLQKGA